MKKITIFFISCFVVAIYTPAFFVFADSAIELDTPMSRVGAKSEVGIFVRTRSDVPINAFEVEITYPQEFIAFVRSSDIESIVGVWQEKPFVVEPGVLRMSGGMFAPFQEEEGILSLLHFQVIKNVSAEINIPISIRRAVVYMADGKGTSQNADARGIELSVAPNIGEYSLVYEADDSGPEISAYTTGSSFGGDPLLVFEIRDPQSGIEKTEVRSYRWFSWSSWHVVSQSFFPRQDAWIMQIRSVNNGGGVSVETVYIWERCAPIIILCFAIFSLFALWYTKKISKM